jgi:spore coat polysaccharide biosynthesis protein SpsF
VIRRAQLTGYPVVLATSTTKEDDVLEDLSKKIGISCFRGSEHNVLERSVMTAEQFGFKAFARLCGDRPLFSIEEMILALNLWQSLKNNKKPDLITNHYPQKAIRGLTTEVIKTSSLREQLDNYPDVEQQEHLTLGFYRDIKSYNILSLEARHKQWENHTGFAVDTKEDYLVLSSMIEKHPQLNYELEAKTIKNFKIEVTS